MVFRGWYIVGAAFLTLLLTVGIPFYGLPFFYDYFIRDFGWSRAETTSGIALATILIQPLAGFVVDRFSPRLLIGVGAGFLLLSLAGFSLGNGRLIYYYVSWCLFMAGYICSGPLPHQVLIARWFRRRRGLAMGVMYLGLGVGGAISQKYVALQLIQKFGWRHALLFMGMLMLLVIPLLFWPIRDTPRELGLWPDGNLQPTSQSVRAAIPLRELWRHPAFWLLAAGSATSIGAIGSINQHMKLLFLDAGLSNGTVANTTFLILSSSLAGRLVMGWLADFFPKKFVMLASYLFVGLPLPLLLVISHSGAPELFAMVFGFGLGADYMLIPLMAAQLFGANSLGRVMGIILPIDSIGQTGFPFLLGLLRDYAGSYTWGIVMVAGLALAGATAVACLPRLQEEPARV
jgi:MFS family permease